MTPYGLYREQREFHVYTAAFWQFAHNRRIIVRSNLLGICQFLRQNDYLNFHGGSKTVVLERNAAAAIPAVCARRTLLQLQTDYETELLIPDRIMALIACSFDCGSSVLYAAGAHLKRPHHRPYNLFIVMLSSSADNPRSVWFAMFVEIRPG